MSKQGQDFLTLVFLGFAFVVTIFWVVRLLVNENASDQTRARALLVLVVYGIGVPVGLFWAGVGPYLWRTLTAPFVN